MTRTQGTPPALAEIPFNDLGRQAVLWADRLTEVARRVLASGWYTLGPETEAFEASFAAACGTAHCVAVGNGTDALEIALRSVGCEAGDEVILTANAGMYATTACVAVGATPVFSDVEPTTLLLSIPAATALCGPRTRAVVATHLYGNVVDVTRLRASLPAGVAIVEDGAQAHGAALNTRPVGSHGDAGAFSFYPTKNLGAFGDAGAVTCSDPEVARRARALRQYGWESRYVAVLPGGRNSRIDELQAALLLEVLPELSERNRVRHEIRCRYERAITGPVELVELAGGDAAPVVHLCVVRSTARTRLREDLRSAGVTTVVHYPVPDHLQAALAEVPSRHEGLAETERACREVLSLPCFPELRDDEVGHVSDVLRRWA